MYDVIIVGGGPSGSTCAAMLGRYGLKVLLLDKDNFPRSKTCGDGISARSLGVIRKLELMDQLLKIPHTPITEVVLGTLDGKQHVVKNILSGMQNCVCKRIHCDNMLFQNAKKYVDAVENFKVTELLKENDKVVGVGGAGENKNYQTFHGKIIVGADGANGVIKRLLGASIVSYDYCSVAVRSYYRGVDINPRAIELHFIKELLPGYFWIFPTDVSTGQANIGLGMLCSSLKQREVHLTDLFEKIIEDKRFRGRFANAVQEGPLLGWSLPEDYLIAKQLVYDNCLLIGDAAGLINPVTGEGIGSALCSGDIAAEVIKDACKQENLLLLKNYDQALYRGLGKELHSLLRYRRFLKRPLYLNTFFFTLKLLRRWRIISRNTLGKFFGLQ